jgi:hypothetical protein
MKKVILLAVVLFAFAPFTTAQLKSNERSRMKEMTQGDLYLQRTLPVRYVLSAIDWFPSTVAVTEVSPAGVTWEKGLMTKHRGEDIVYWGFGPNAKMPS